MAKKNTSGRKPGEETELTVGEVSGKPSEAPVPETNGTATAEAPPSKQGKAKSTEDPTSSGSVGLGDIRKAVAFANSVGGLDKAIALLQIVKVAKEVQ